MPLESGKSEESFKHNVEAEIAAGKPQKQAVAIAYAKQDEAKDFSDSDGGSHREIDENDYMTIKDNPIICAGVFRYKGSSLPDADPDRIYNVYRPLEELERPETLASFIGLPIIDEHEMLGGKYERSPEERGVHGSILESIRIDGKDVLANLRIWSRTLKGLIDRGKRGLSLGYKTKFEKSSGVFEGMRYDYIQKNIRGNHLALVNHGRNATTVLDESDVFDHFDLALDNMEKDNMAYDDKKDDKAPEKEVEKKDATEGTELDIHAVHKWAKENMPKYHELKAMMEPAEEEDEVALDGDTKEKPGDQAEDEEKEEKMEKKEAMDSADVVRLVNAGIKNAHKSLLADVTKRDTLARDLTPILGTFDYAAMDSAEVAEYGIKKLGLEAAKGQEHAVLSGYLAGVKKSESKIGFAMDSAIKPKEGSLLAKTLSKAV